MKNKNKDLLKECFKPLNPDYKEDTISQILETLDKDFEKGMEILDKEFARKRKREEAIRGYLDEKFDYDRMGVPYSIRELKRKWFGEDADDILL